MSLLFETSPLDDPKKKRSKKKVVAQEPEPEMAVAPAPPPRPMVAIGRIDDGYECCDKACGGTAHDIMQQWKTTRAVEHGDEWIDVPAVSWRIECCFCGTAQVVEGIVGHIPEPDWSQDYTLPDGRAEFVGLTLKQIEAAGGRWYIDVLAKKGEMKSTREACAKYVARFPASR
jgi:hypothetical protein